MKGENLAHQRFDILLCLIRITGRRQTGMMTPFDFILLLILSNTVQNAMNGGDNSLVGGLISALTLIGLNYAVAWLVFKSKWVEALVEGNPKLLIRNGILNEEAMRSELLTHHELSAALRAAGCSDIEHVRSATLENNGQITVSLRPVPARGQG